MTRLRQFLECGERLTGGLKILPALLLRPWLLNCDVIDEADASAQNLPLEVELLIDPNWEPVPDVIGTTHKIIGHYPTQPVEVVIEILSPEDPMSRMLEKCSHYSRIGVQATFLVDPDKKIGWFWNAKTEKLERVRSLALPNGNEIDLAEAFAELDKQS